MLTTLKHILESKQSSTESLPRIVSIVLKCKLSFLKYIPPEIFQILGMFGFEDFLHKLIAKYTHRVIL